MTVTGTFLCSSSNDEPFESGKTYSITIYDSTTPVTTKVVTAVELTFGVPNTVTSDAGLVPPVDQSAEPSSNPADDGNTVSEAQPPETV